MLTFFILDDYEHGNFQDALGGEDVDGVPFFCPKHKVCYMA